MLFYKFSASLLSHTPPIIALFVVFYNSWKLLTFILGYDKIITAISDLICKQPYLSKSTTPNSIKIKVIASTLGLDIYKEITSDDLQIFFWFYSSCNIILVLLLTSTKYSLVFKSTWCAINL